MIKDQSIKDQLPQRYRCSSNVINLVWTLEFMGMRINPLIAQQTAAVLVKFLRVWIAFPVVKMSGNLHMLHTEGR